MREYLHWMSCVIVVLLALCGAVYLGTLSSNPITIPSYLVGIATGVVVFVVASICLFISQITFWDLIFSYTRRQIFIEDGVKEYWPVKLVPSIVVGLVSGWYAGEYFIIPGVIVGYLLIATGIYFFVQLQLGGLPEINDDRRAQDMKASKARY